MELETRLITTVVRSIATGCRGSPWQYPRHVITCHGKSWQPTTISHGIPRNDCRGKHYGYPHGASRHAPQRMASPTARHGNVHGILWQYPRLRYPRKGTRQAPRTSPQQGSRQGPRGETPDKARWLRRKVYSILAYLWVGAGCPMRWAHCGVKVPNGNRVPGGFLVLGMSADTAVGSAAGISAVGHTVGLAVGSWSGHGRGARRGMPRHAPRRVSAGTTPARAAAAPWPMVAHRPCHGMPLKSQTKCSRARVGRVPTEKGDVLGRWPGE